MKYKIVFLLLFLFLVSGCSFNKTQLADDSWKNDVLMAQECGIDGLKCCADTNPSCQYGQQCCVDPNDDKNNYCADTCDYGKLNTYCRKGELQCDEGLACSDSKCLNCGGENQPCCSGEKCGEELLCHQGECVRCGLPGNPCCANARACAGQANRDSARDECRDNICTFCGSNNGAACLGEPKCNQGQLLNNDFCLPCGGYNEPCCNKEVGLNYECRPNEGLTCLLGFCSQAK